MDTLKGWPNGFVFYNSSDIKARGIIIDMFTETLEKRLTTLNPAVRFIQVETPISTPESMLRKHEETGFELVPVEYHKGSMYLRPETTAGTLHMLEHLYPLKKQFKKRLPLVLFQHGKSFRNEQARPFGELRFREFYQLEYQLVAAEDSMAPYFETIVDAVTAAVDQACNKETTGTVVEDLAHYAKRTTDIHIDTYEVAAVSERNDMEGYLVFEASIGLDRVTALRGFML